MSASLMPEPTRPVPARLREIVERRFALSVEVPARFVEAHAGVIAAACLAMARRFEQGGRLLAFGLGPEASDAQHVAVEFIHPVLVGKRALPAIALSGEVPVLSGRDPADAFARLLATLGRGEDIALGITRDEQGEAVRLGLAQARRMGMLTLAATGGDAGGADTPADVDFRFVVPATDPLVVQEVQETLYHVIWELVHVFFDPPRAP